MRYVRLDEAIRTVGLPRELVDALLEVELIHARRTLDADEVISLEEAEDLRVARTLMEELGVNQEGVEVILRMRRRQMELQRRMDQLVATLRSELRVRLREADLLEPFGLLPGP